MTTFADLQQEVIDHQFSFNKYNDFALKQLHRAEAIVCEGCDFREMETTVPVTTTAGVPGYALPGDFDRNYALWRIAENGQSIAVTKKTPTQFDELPPQSGAPTMYTVFADTIRLWPTPDAVYSLAHDYYAKPATDSDSPVIPETYRHILVDFALARCYARENDYNSAQYHQGVFDTEYQKMLGKIHYDTNDRGQPRVIGDQSV